MNQKIVIIIFKRYLYAIDQKLERSNYTANILQNMLPVICHLNLKKMIVDCVFWIIKCYYFKIKMNSGHLSKIHFYFSVLEC
jgi:hypothetical protein